MIIQFLYKLALSEDDAYDGDDNGDVGDAFSMFEAHVSLCQPLRHLGNMSSASVGEPDRAAPS